MLGSWAKKALTLTTGVHAHTQREAFSGADNRDLSLAKSFPFYEPTIFAP